MKTLLEQINEQDNQIYIIEAQLASMKAKLRDLEIQRAYCPHQFDPAIEGREQDGGICKLCGISEAFAGTLAQLQAFFRSNAASAGH